jgi:diguanylate cyclase (GGDEF)-like protein
MLPAADPLPGARLALLVATGTYTDPRLRRLRAPARDASDLAEVLGDPGIGGFTVITAIDQPAQQVRLAIEDFLDGRQTRDLLLVYLSCHGLLDTRRRLHFAAADTRMDRLASTAVDATWVLDQLEHCRARCQVLILDSCFSGAFAHGAKGEDDVGLGNRFLGQGRGRAILTASTATEYSFEGDPTASATTAAGSVFTAALVNGLRTGAADINHDGHVSVDDAYLYVYDQVRATGAAQTPQRWLYGTEGQIVLARNPAGHASTLAALPESLRAALSLDDVTDPYEALDKLAWLATHDQLTQLPNKALLKHLISQALGTLRQTGTILGVLFVDFDDFKDVNDSMGHSAGDELLVAATGRLVGLIGESGTAARFGDDEFMVLVSNAEDSAVLRVIADGIVRAFREPFTLASGPVTATVSIGVSTSEDSADPDELLRHADLALYAAKAAGKRRSHLYQPELSAGLLRRRELQEALEEAVETSAFTLVYQPIVDLSSRELAGFEALVQWPHPQWGMMPPDQFITVAEETGQIIALGAWVLGRATAEFARWRRELPGAEQSSERPNLYISVNVSARQFADPGFADSVRRVLGTSGLESRNLMLELTETALLWRDERLHSDLAELKLIGVKLAIDDFGTGYSSLSYLRELPIDVVKMDKSFVEGIAESGQRLALAEGIVQIARTLRLEVIAEGIETEIQRDLLASMGCHYGQGNLLAVPMALSDARNSR